jgi:predicted kinase
LLNGSFGVGKTTTAAALRRRLPGSTTYDPETLGSIFQRLPSWVPLGGQRTDDFQDLRLWRQLTIRAISIATRVSRGPVLVPMTFSRHEYFDEVVAGLSQRGVSVVVFCLQASLDTVRQRLAARGTPLEGQGSQWIRRRVVECAAIFQGHRFGTPVDTESRTVDDVADAIIASLRATWARRDDGSQLGG